MTVQELIDRLKKLPRGLEVDIASDEEGNDFHSLKTLGLEKDDDGNDLAVTLWP